MQFIITTYQNITCIMKAILLAHIYYISIYICTLYSACKIFRKNPLLPGRFFNSSEPAFILTNRELYIRALHNVATKKIITLLRPLGRIRPKRIHLGIPPISPRRRRGWAGLHAADTLRHACIDFVTCSDDQGSRQFGLCPSRERSVSGRRGHMWGYRSFPAVLKRLRA